MRAIVMDEGKEKATAEASGRPLVHSQVRRIREEELRITDEGPWSARDRIALLHLSSHVDTILRSRSPPILPSSPLGNKAAIGSSLC